MKRFVFSLCVMLVCQLLTAQPYRGPRRGWPAELERYLRADTVSVDEMVESYKAIKAGTRKAARLADFDHTRFGNTVFVGSVLTGQPLFAGKPVTAEWSTLAIDTSRVICITDLVCPATGKRDTALWTSATQSLGLSADRYRSPRVEGIPARWVDGVSVCLEGALPYFGFLVGNQRTARRVKNGRFEKGYVWEACRSYYRSCSGLHVARLDGEWAMDLRLTYVLLSHDASQACGVDSAYWRNPRAYDLLLTLDGAGRMDVVPLSFDAKTDDPALDKRALDGLRRFVRSLPPYALDVLYSADGRVFPGRYVRAYRLVNGWNIKDYLQEAYAKQSSDLEWGRKMWEEAHADK